MSLRAHPRVRGEHEVDLLDACPHMGSSPRSRGAQEPPGVVGVAHGLIPAFAGSTPKTATRSGPSRAHPRVRGEHPTRFGCPCAATGSSPRSRGAPRQTARRRKRRGLIPAFAGSTLVELALRCSSSPKSIGLSRILTSPGTTRRAVPARLTSAGTGLCSRSKSLACVRPPYNPNSVDIHGLPVVSMYSKIQSLLIARARHHDRAAVFDELFHPLPQQIADAPGQHPDKDAGTDLEQPPGQVATQASWARGDDENYHGTSKSSWVEWL